MQKKSHRNILSFLLVTILCGLCCGCHNQITGVLNPKGIITYEERQLLFDTLALMLIVVLPVIIMSFAFIVRYRSSHPMAEYKPNWCHNVSLECIWWGVPMAIIIVVGIMTWRSTHKLDPYNNIDMPGKPMIVKVVALPWKWLFIYPKENVASVNYLVIPKNKQVEFMLTTDNVPMSAFFIPQLGSQIYTMAGMRTRLHLAAAYTGTYEGLNSQYNGDGFSDMHFKVKVVNNDDLQKWFKQVKQSSLGLNEKNYQTLRQASIKAPVQYYSSVKPNLFKDIIKSYKMPNHP